MEKITFLRHGEILSGCSWNDLEKVNMLEDTITLSKNGINQATELGKVLNPSDFDAIVVADSIRTLKTAEIINSYLKKPIEIEPAFNAWRASKTANFISFNDYWTAYYEFVSCNGISSNASWETFEELKQRTLEGFYKYEKYNSILLISHSIIISLYTGISKDGIGYCCPKTINKIDLKCLPPDFISTFF